MAIKGSAIIIGIIVAVAWIPIGHGHPIEVFLILLLVITPHNQIFFGLFQTDGSDRFKFLGLNSDLVHLSLGRIAHPWPPVLAVLDPELALS